MKGIRIMTGLSSVVSFLLIVSIIGTNTLMAYSGTVNSALGIETSRVVNPEGTDLSEAQYFESEFGELNSSNLQKLIEATYEQSVVEQEEGSVLLTNKDGALPLSTDERSVTLFGHAVVQPVYKAPSAGSKGHESEYKIDLKSALEDQGFSVNNELFKAYENSKTARGTGAYDFQTQTTSEWSMGEESQDFYTDELKSSWDEDYNDVAIVMLAREGGEGVELYTETPSEGKSQLSLTQEEKDLLQMIKDSNKFDKTIVLLNSGWPMEVNWLDDYNVDGSFWIGLPGQRGFEGVVNLITGEANPSGHLTDIYAVDSLSAPAVVNGSYNNQQWTNTDQVVSETALPEDDVSYYTVQAEGIYVGYKYYETRYEDAVLNQGNATSKPGSSSSGNWEYQNEVSFPFGYGLSYSSFEQSLESVSFNGDLINIDVKVTNTGDVPGKSVVQVYSQTPYGEYEKENKVEKASIQLLDFGKTGVLNPGESEVVSIEAEKYLLASYDYNKEKGYILSEGDYYISIGDDAHDALNNVLASKGATGMVDISGNPVEGNTKNTYMWFEDFDNQTFNMSRYTDIEVTNQFADADINYWIEDAVTYLSRDDWEATYPTQATKLTASDEMIERLKGYSYEKPEGAPSIDSFTIGKNQSIPLAAMIGLDYDDPKWDEYLDQYTLEELSLMVVDNFGTKEIASVGKPEVIGGDGPDGPGGTYNKSKYGDDRTDTTFPSQIILASTFNKDLMARRGELMGEEALYLGMSQVWMPGGNLHRTPFGGRNFEYYSEDSIMTYLSSIPEIEGIESRGVHAGPKHLTGNDQEINREGISTFFNEQAFREGSLRGFESMLTIAGAQTVMHGFNRIGLEWCSTSEALVTNVVVDEWGFKGQQISDAVASAEEGYKADYLSALAAGTDTFCLDFTGVSGRVILEAIQKNDDGNLLGLLRNSIKDYLYTVANSSVMNGYTTDSIVESITPWWIPTTYSMIGLFTVLEALCLFLLYRTIKKSDRAEQKKVIV